MTWPRRAAVLVIALAWMQGAVPGLARDYAGGAGKPVLPAPPGYVSDYANLIDADWQTRIREVCRELEDRTGVEMIVVTVPTVGAYPHARAYAERLYAEWRIGMAQQERGMALLVSAKERQAVVVLGRNVLATIGQPELDELSERHLLSMFRNARYGESLYRTAVGLASAAGGMANEAGRPKRSSRAGFWMTAALVAGMVFVLWRFTRPERRHPFQRWRRGEYWGTGRGGFGGTFGSFGAGGRNLS